MKVNEEISPIKDNLINMNNPNSYPDIIGQVDKVINKYKRQLEQLKPKKDLDEIKIPQYPSSEKKNNKYSKFVEMKQIETDPYFNKVNNNIQNKNNHFKTEINNYIYEDINEEEKFNNHPNINTNTNRNNNYNYNFNYKTDFTDLKLPEYNKNRENIYNNNNSNKIYPIDNNNLNNDLSQEIQNDNMKLGSALTMEKSKVVQLLNLLKIKEGEINNLKQQIDNFEIKINDIENKYQNIIHSLESKQYEKLNDIYNNLSNEKNQFEIDYDNIKRNNELKFEQINDELRNYQKVLKLFFDLFNKNIDLFNKTEILPDKNIFIKESDFTEENAYLAVDVIDKLINKLVQDNKDLFNELIRLNEEMKNMNNSNDDFIKQENYSLRQLVNNLTKENNILKSNKNMNNINSIPKSNNYRISKNNQIGEREIRNSNHHHHIIHSGCRNCTPDCFRSNRSNRDLNLFDNLKLKITDLENQIKNQTSS